MLHLLPKLTEYGFIIRSDKFDVEKSYALTIAKGSSGKNRRCFKRRL